jgi:CHASE3 domain sensor protein
MAVMPPEVEEELELEELLDDELDELELLLEDDEELDDELDELELLELEPLEEPLIDPAEAVSVTRSILDPSSRRRMRSVWEPAARLLKVAGVRVAYPLVAWLF